MPQDNDETAPMLEVPTDLPAIWLARGDDVEVARPLIQGDIFEGIALPGFEDDPPGLALIIDHPCSMRSGVALRPRIQMLRVREERGLPRQGWPKGQYRLMPLPGLAEDTRYAAFFDETAMVSTSTLDSTHRLACLSEYGILVLQQRLVHHLTRVPMQLPTLRTASIHILEEVELQEEWTAGLAATQPGEQPDDARAREADRFDVFMREPLAGEGPSRRDALKNELQRSTVRKAVRQEIRRRTASED